MTKNPNGRISYVMEFIIRISNLKAFFNGFHQIRHRLIKWGGGPEELGFSHHGPIDGVDFSLLSVIKILAHRRAVLSRRFCYLFNFFNGIFLNLNPFSSGDLCRFRNQFLHQSHGLRIIQELAVFKSGQSGQGIDPYIDDEFSPHLVVDIRGNFCVDSCLAKHLSN